MAILCGQTFLVMLQRHNFLCTKKKVPSGNFNMPVFLNLAEGNDLDLDKGTPCFKSSINITPIYSLTTHTITLHFELSYYNVLFLQPKKGFSTMLKKLTGYCFLEAVF